MAKKQNKGNAKMLWQGRLEATPEEIVFNYMSAENIALDAALVEHDIKGSMAHAVMLHEKGLLSLHEAKAILSGLEVVLADYKKGDFALERKLEDVHMNVEAKLTEIDAHGKKLHTARSRNDQINLDMRMYMRAEIITLLKKLHALGVSLEGLSKQSVPMPAYTHTRVAQPISVSYWANSYFDGFFRDAVRLSRAYDMLNTNPLGSGAVAGTTLPIDRGLTAKLLGFASVQENSLDCSSNRGEFEAQVAFVCSLIMTRLSRMCEELIWQSQKGLVALPDKFCTGSSMMPQKKNADILELVRGRSARAYASLSHILVAMKGVPSGYNSDLQETKYAVMQSISTAQDSLEIMSQVVPSLKFDKAKMLEEIEQGYACATELADLLVKQGVPFRDAHAKVGGIVKHCIEKKVYLSQLTAEQVELATEVLLDKKELAAALSPDKSKRYDMAVSQKKLEEIRKMAQGREKMLLESDRLLWQQVQRITSSRA